MKSRKLVTSRRLALMTSRGVCWQPRHQQDEEAADEEPAQAAPMQSHVHIANNHPPRLRVGITQWLKATVIFWTRALHDSDAYRDPRLV